MGYTSVKKYLFHLNRMENNGLPKFVVECKPKGYRDIRNHSEIEVVRELAQA